MEALIDEAFRAVPRIGFLPASQRRHVDLDQPLVLAAGQTCSQPSTVRRMLTLLGVRAGDRVLDVGSGSGWTTALLAHLVGPTGRVDGVEIVPELAAWGRSNVEATGMAWAAVHLADAAVMGLPDQAPFDRILVSAEATQVPEDLAGQLAEDGRMVIPVRGRMTVVERHGQEAHMVESSGSYRFVPLIVLPRGRHRGG